MSRAVTQLRLRLRSLVRARQVEDELHDELGYHLERLTDDHVAAGMPREEARRAARREMGPLEPLKEQCRDARGLALFDTLRQEVRYAARGLLNNPGFTAVAVLSLAFGIGANTAIFSLVNSLLLRPLPVVEPQRLALVTDSRALQGNTSVWTYDIWDQIRARAQPFDGACAWWTERLNMAPSGGETQPVDTMWVSGEYFTTLGVPALLGRPLAPEDDVLGGSRDRAVAVISYGLWQRHFGGVADTIGMPITIEHVPFTVVGIMPAAFFGAEVGRTFDVALPMSAELMIRGGESRMTAESGYFALTVLLRLKPGQSMDTATAIMRGLQPHIRDAAISPKWPPAFRNNFLQDPLTVVPAATGTSRLRVMYARPLVVILAVAALVLLITCANIANLQLARAIARRYELGVRMALGASRVRLARQWFIESLMLAIGGAGLGLLFASWSSQVLVAQLSTELSRVYLELSLDWRVLTFATATTVATTILFGTLPALRAARAVPMAALREQTRGSWTTGPTGLSNGFVIAQVALSVVIVVAAGLFVRSFAKLVTLPLGFDSDRVLLVSVNIAHTPIAIDERVPFFDRLVRQLAGVPGVAHAAASMNTPVTGLGIVDVLHVPGSDTSSRQPMVNGRPGARTTFVNVVTPGWFATYGTPIRAGRDFDTRDAKGSPLAIIVNEAFVGKFLPGQNPIGAVVEFERGRETPVAKTIVGVVNNAVYGSLRNAEAPTPTEYASLAQQDFPGPPPTEITISVRVATGAPMGMARSIAVALKDLDPNVVLGFRPMTDQVRANVVQERVVAALSGFFGVLALLLAGVGLYGITAYTVASRRTELGIRTALGATGPRVVRLVVSRVALLVGVGIFVGATLSAWLSTFVTALIFGVEPHDPATLIGAGLILAAVGILAASVPAWRAVRIDPAAVLREG